MSDAWPNLFLIGAGKSGTTSIHRYLDEHPSIFMSPEKEPHFFSHTWDDVGDDPDALDEALEAYRALFEDAGQAPIRGESSHSYLWHADAPQRIEDTVDEARFMVSLRDPVQRAYSAYLMGHRLGKTRASFLEAVRREIDEGLDAPGQGRVKAGLYHRHLERYIDRFGREAVLVLLMDELKNDPLELLKRIARFVEVDEAAMEEVGYDQVHNPYGEPRNRLALWLRNSEPVKQAARLLLPERVRIYLGEHVLVEKPEKPPMDPEARALLEEVYEPEIAKLEDLLDRSLPELRASWETR